MLAYRLLSWLGISAAPPFRSRLRAIRVVTIVTGACQQVSRLAECDGQRHVALMMRYCEGRPDGTSRA